MTPRDPSGQSQPPVVRRGGHHAALALRARRRHRQRPGAIPVIVDETLEPLDPSTIAPGDVVGIGIHTGNARRGYEIGRQARERGAWVVYGGIHATLFPDEAREHGAAHAVVKGDGDLVWPHVVRDCLAGDAAGACTTAAGCAGDEFVPGTLGPAAGRTLHVGVGADRARLPQALLVLLGVAHRRPGAAPARGRSASSARSSNCAAAGSASSRSPTTTSIRSRSTTWPWRAGARTRRACTSWRRCATSASS